ncbi:MAG: hypothetical protein AAGH90_11225 [Pseudomonadota bacterium]
MNFAWFPQCVGFFLAVLGLPVTAQEGQPIPVDGPDYYSSGETIPGIGPARACSVPEEALASPESYSDWYYKHSPNPNFSWVDDAGASLVWEAHNINEYAKWHNVIDQAMWGCKEVEELCPNLNRRKKFKSIWDLRKKKNQSFPYKRWYSKRFGNKPGSELTALRYATMGACAIPRDSDFTKHLSGVVFGDFPNMACEAAKRMPSPAGESEWDQSLVRASFEYELSLVGIKHDSRSKVSREHTICPLLSKARYEILMEHGDLQLGSAAELRAAAQRDAEAAMARQTALESGRKRWKERYGYTNLLDHGGSYGTCQDAKTYARAAQTWTGANLERQWWFFYQRDPNGACSMIPEAFFTARKTKRPDPVPTEKREDPYTLSEGFRDLGNAIQQDTQDYLDCMERAERTGGVCRRN